MVGVGRGATAGVLVKDAAALETLERVDTLVVDKTGTLTEGRPSLRSVEPAPGITDFELLHLAASVEQHSEHPLARAIVQGADARGLELSPPAGFESVTGGGVRGSVEGRSVLVGTQTLLRARGIAVGDLERAADDARQQGDTAMFVAVDGAAAGMLSVSDAIKPTTADALELLRARGLHVVMLTGDSRRTAESVARRLNIDEVHAEVLPQDKHRIVRELQQQGRVVAMAGDGINDAPALAQADVGIAMGNGTDVAMHSASVVLVRGDLRGIARARTLSVATMKNIRTNLVFAFVYNALGVPLAAGVLYPAFGILLSPMLASAAMSLSSVSVVLNALRLRKVRL
jgi:Cu+-exporting ATPase